MTERFFFGASDAAAYAERAYGTFRRDIRAGRIPKAFCGRVLVFSREQLDDYRRNGYRTTITVPTSLEEMAAYRDRLIAEKGITPEQAESVARRRTILGLNEAAAYCGLQPSGLKYHVYEAKTIAGIDLGEGGIGFRVADLDAFLVDERDRRRGLG